MAAAPGLNSNAALDAGANRPATLTKPGAERSQGQVPERLDEALRYAVARIEEDPQNVDAIIGHLGWDGRDPRNGDVLLASIASGRMVVIPIAFALYVSTMPVRKALAIALNYLNHSEP